MEKVSFKRGLQENLPADGNASIGAFYLTTDTNKLYIGDNNKNLKTLGYEKRQEIITIPVDGWMLNNDFIYELIITSTVFGVEDEPLGFLYLSKNPEIQALEEKAYDCISSMEVLEDGIHVYCNQTIPTYEFRIKLTD